MKKYDWTGAICYALMSFVRNFHRTSEKVTGCVVSLLCWLCEHSTIMESYSEDRFPRFLKWNLGVLLLNAHGVNLKGQIDFQVRYERLVAGANEICCLEGGRPGGDEGGGFGEEVVGVGGLLRTDVRFVSDEQVVVSLRAEPGESSDYELRGNHIDSKRVGSSGGALSGGGHAALQRGGNCRDREMDLQQTLKTIANLEVQISTKNNDILNLEREVDKLRRSNKMHTLHLVGGVFRAFSR